jgi:chorismate mutase
MERNTLDFLREQIDRTDTEILYLLKRRFQTVKKIAKYKKSKNLEIFDNNRENEIIFDRINNSRNMELNENFIRELFELILAESKKIQKDIIEDNK